MYRYAIVFAAVTTRIYGLSSIALSTSGVSLQVASMIPNLRVDDTDDLIAEEQNKIAGKESTSTMDTMDIKRQLLDLLPRMTGTKDEYELVETYVNTLEDRYTPVQTLDFLNLAMAGDWQLLFSTNLSGSSRKHFRLRDLFQQIETNGLNGTIVNEASWDLAQDYDANSSGSPKFDVSGNFLIKCNYSIEAGSRMDLSLKDHVINLAKGSNVITDPQELVALLFKAIPTELFDPNEHIMDTTYLDGDLRIVRMSGTKFESVRDIFMRRGSMEINPL